MPYHRFRWFCVASLCLAVLLWICLPRAAHGADVVPSGGLERLAVVGGQSGDVVLRGGRAYVAEGQGVTVFDATTPANLTPHARIVLAVRNRVKDQFIHL